MDFKSTKKFIIKKSSGDFDALYYECEYSEYLPMDQNISAAKTGGMDEIVAQREVLR